MNETQLPKDPFEYKSLSKRNPIRIAHKIQAELLEYWSALTFKRAELPIKLPSESCQESLEFDREDTAVTDEHMSLLLDCIKETNSLGESVAEIGAFRGVTSAMLIAISTNPSTGGSQSALALETKELPSTESAMRAGIKTLVANLSRVLSASGCIHRIRRSSPPRATNRKTGVTMPRIWKKFT